MSSTTSSSECCIMLSVFRSKFWNLKIAGYIRARMLQQSLCFIYIPSSACRTSWAAAAANAVAFLYISKKMAAVLPAVHEYV